MESSVILESTITCPHCQHKSKEVMPLRACQYFYECPSCHTRIKAQPGDCCVYCSYGDIPCPPIQQSSKDGCCGV
ncbi:GDCCVxC domain-containing (seleno)protein [Pontibacter sp. G13]|uniref:GDCCVxC domain-containing (seleno)protein n=1 Tax=Pontibacter sp. G13 TaxID=3074898 RepID=UPI00288C2564|nr:GDCCVxC domain-containing (seleno)protein [Pontibacter sp. G13]WNJ16441.1 GDCCVxC domain-containing (seleno)protein [Pontibacter sp. G13]